MGVGLQPADELRVSDADRERVVAQLGDHLSQGRLTVDEFSDRVAEALSARTARDLAISVRELPVEQPAPDILDAIAQEQRKRRWRRWRNDIAAFVTTNGTCIGIWTLMGADTSFWPRWVLLFSGIGLAGRIISGETKDEKKAREEAAKRGLAAAALATGEYTERVVATVLFVDIVGSTEQAVLGGDRRLREILSRFGALVRTEFARFSGREVFMRGDEAVGAFHSPAQAIRCACAIRDGAGAIGFRVRAGLHAGEVDRTGDDFSGIALHIGQRVSMEAGPSEVLVSSTVRDLAVGSGVTFTDRGEHELKGVPETWRLYAVAAARELDSTSG